MTRLQNFTLGTFVAIILMGPAAWSGAREAVANTETLVVSALTGPAAQSTMDAARTVVRSANLPK